MRDISAMSAECPHPRTQGLGAAELSELLAHADARLVAAGQRWTEPRRRVFEMLARAGAPAKAYDLIAAYDENEPGSTKPPTVYRALEFLESLGLAHRIPSLNAYIACAGGQAVHAASFLICDCCGSAAEFDPGVADLASAMAQARSFQPRTISVEVRGVCGACDAAGEAAA
jgi:Fur family transcriptional regulator, zinc uptake regulator